MAWTDQCKLEARRTIKKMVEEQNLTVTEAIKRVSEESGIPAATLQRWYYPRMTKVKNDPNGENATQTNNSVETDPDYATSNITKHSEAISPRRLVECARKLREQFSGLFVSWKQMIQQKRLTGDRELKHLENEIRLLLIEARELGLDVFIASDPPEQQHEPAT